MKKLLIVIDMQKDFIDGALGTPEAAAIVPKVREKILSYPPEAVYATMDTHGENYFSTQEGRRLPVVHCLRGTEGWALDPALAPLIPRNTSLKSPPSAASPWPRPWPPCRTRRRSSWWASARTSAWRPTPCC